MFKMIIFLVINYSITVNLNPLHDFHISFGESVLTSHEFSGKITFYKDDFFKSLKKWSGSKKNLSNKDYDQLKLSYLQNHLAIVVNKNENLLLELIDHSEDETTIWFSFKFKSDNEIKIIKIRYEALFNEFDDQMNLLNVAKPSDVESFIFKKSNPEIIIEY